MSRSSRTVRATPATVWAVLSRGQAYGDWVVGTTSIRRVDHDFPAAGSALHYRVGWGRLSMDGHTQVLAVEPGRSLRLEAHGWPAGCAEIELTLEPVEGGTIVRHQEHPVRGVMARLHNPLFDHMIHVRNREGLRRLARLAENS